tara:strand:+ start:833 stop:1006 length:174 start_codon:yes stop_codon:yes gene_type:complete
MIGLSWPYEGVADIKPPKTLDVLLLSPGGVLYNMLKSLKFDFRKTLDINVLLDIFLT